MRSTATTNGHNINGSRPSSPPAVHFTPSTHSPLIEGRPAPKTRSLSNTTLSSTNQTPTRPGDCEDDNCAFGWETYVADHNYESSTTEFTRLPIHSLLHEEEGNPLLQECEKGAIRHVHLPANNMKWVEARFTLLISRTRCS